MEPVHAAFASEPATRLTLETLLAAFDVLDPSERHAALAPVICDVLCLPAAAVGPCDDSGRLRIYERFKRTCGTLRQTVRHGFLAYSLLARILAWLCHAAGAEFLSQRLADEHERIRKAGLDLDAGRIDRAAYDAVLLEAGERIAALPAEHGRARRRYAWFCETVVKPFVSAPVAV